MSGRVAIVGVGRAGSSLAYSIVNREICNELVLYDINSDKLLGEYYDLTDASTYCVSKVKVIMGSIEDCAKADVVVIAAGNARYPGQDPKENFVLTRQICRSTMDQLVVNGFSGVVIVFSVNENAIMDDLLKYTGYNPLKLIGAGSDNVTKRMAMILSEKYSMESSMVENLYLIGDDIPTYSSATYVGTDLAEAMEGVGVKETPAELVDMANERGFRIGKLKYSTYYGVASATADIVKAIVNDENRIFSLCVHYDHYIGESEVYASAPVMLGKGGIKKYIVPYIDEKEKSAFHKSIENIRKKNEQFNV